ncbi:putative EamA domain-containing protein [Helianthus annuus]|nr:putative EamA domain-containing protein [Helianthus annuus]KAJ0479310.1 putative EamA domain-containing protein [Helianthus annuus]KAJ0662298.1 putative EamA domain-containing protein [Helianthus annuus]KAJ0669827.1 putative EamA domain-containing protein [Helianthus annuus]KAJ0847598.1 putative EamA domain-containing protein [Helianthus annuus]
MEGKLGCFARFFLTSKPYIAMICLQFGYAGMNIITKVSLNRGMSHYVLVVYRHAFATAAIAPFALYLERNIRPKITFSIFMQMFVLGLLGPVIDQNFYYAGLKLTSPTFSCAMSNMLPAMTFVMAVLCRMEILDMKKVRCQAKVIGTIVTVAGAMLMTLYKGNVVELFWTKHVHTHHVSETTSATSGSSDKDWVFGSILLIIATFAWASFFILQNVTMRKYTAPLSLTCLVCFIGTLQSIAVTLVMDHKPGTWTIGWDMNLLAAAYAGIVSSSIAYYVQGLVMEKRGPVFVTAFSPLMMIIVAIMGSFILAEKIYMGGVMGAILIVIGLYAVLWGKYKEHKEKELAEEILDPVKANSGNNNNMNMMITDSVEVNDLEMQRNEMFKSSVPTIAINAAMPTPPMIAVETPRV